MASYRKRGKTWTAEIWRKGVRQARTFRTKLEAQHWASGIETEIESGRYNRVPDKPFADLLDRYGREVTVTKRGKRPELHRLAAISRDPLGSVRLPELGPPDFAGWRDRRLKVVSAAAVLRDWTILSHACRIARREWHWLDSDPMEGVRRPKQNKPRERIATDAEVERILIALGYDDETPPVLVMQRVGAAWLFAIETGMRQGEIAGLLETDVDLHRSVAHLRQTKNGQERAVPLSPRARDILRHVRAVTKPDPRWFGMNVSQVTPLFIKARKAAMIDNLTFHDSRRMATTRLSKKMDVLDLARMIGHRDIRQLMTYYRMDAEAVAKLLR